MKIKSNPKYNGVVCKLTDVRKHPNADRLQVAKVLDYDIIVGLDAREGDIGIMFEAGGKLSHEMCMANGLYRKDPITGEKMGGYFESTGRVKCTKLRSVNSEAYFTQLTALSWASDNFNAGSLKEGTKISEIDGNKICEKYYTRATIRAMNKAARKYRKPNWLPSFLSPIHKKYIVDRVKHDPCPEFKKHFDTGKLRMVSRMIPDDLVVHISSKRHGTSGRTGYVRYDDRNFIQRLFRTKVKYRHVTGTRNVVKNPNIFGKRVDDGYYAGTDFRFNAHNQVIKGLNKDEIVYYEILGFCGEATPIMPNHTLAWPDFKSQGFSKEEFQDLVDNYSETVTYHYGNNPGEFSTNVYRITQNGRDLSNQKMLQRCDDLGLNPVPQITTTTSDIDLMAEAKKWSEQLDGDGQLREGVCLRLEDTEGNLVKIVKYKSTTFCVLENIKRNDVEYVDLEEIS